MDSLERKTVLSLSTIYAFRMLGLFMILPIFSLYAGHFKHANITLIGLALGIYGLTQALLQIPFGMVSDRIGRKPVIIFGLILFAIGSIVAAESHSIYMIILGRAIQGAGAVGSTLTALVADHTKEENRLKAMATVGMTIGGSFVLAMILGPILNGIIGLSGIFWLTAVLAVIGILIMIFVIPSSKQHLMHRDSSPVLSQFKKILLTKELLRLDFGIFSLHTTLTALFIVVPLVLLKTAGIDANHQWMIYLPVLILSFFAMVPFIIIAESKRKMKSVFTGAILAILIALILLSCFHTNVYVISFILFIFFTAFTLLEASLPSLIAKTAPAGNKGTAMGIYSSSQFLGIFVGGTVGGYIFHHGGIAHVFMACGALIFIWFLLAATMKKPKHLSSKVLAIKALKTKAAADKLHAKLIKLDGVEDVMICIDEKVAYLKVDKKLLNEATLAKAV